MPKRLAKRCPVGALHVGRQLLDDAGGVLHRLRERRSLELAAERELERARRLPDRVEPARSSRAAAARRERAGARRPRPRPPRCPAGSRRSAARRAGSSARRGRRLLRSPRRARTSPRWRPRRERPRRSATGRPVAVEREPALGRAVRVAEGAQVDAPARRAPRSAGSRRRAPAGPDCAAAARRDRLQLLGERHRPQDAELPLPRARKRAAVDASRPRVIVAAVVARRRREPAARGRGCWQRSRCCCSRSRQPRGSPSRSGRSRTIALAAAGLLDRSGRRGRRRAPRARGAARHARPTSCSTAPGLTSGA